jgi:hypothetical protein
MGRRILCDKTALSGRGAAVWLLSAYLSAAVWLLSGYLSAAAGAPSSALLAAPAELDALPHHRFTLRPYTVEAIVPEPGHGVPLLDPEGMPLGPVLPQPQFCALAARGSGVIGPATYQVIDMGPVPQAYCGMYFPRLQRRQPLAAVNLSRSRFVKLDWPFGLGAYDYRLVPAHTAAAVRFDLGTVLFAPALRGLRLADGSIHDGYLLIGDAAEDRAREDLALYAGLAGAGAPAAAPLPPQLEVYEVRDEQFAAPARARYRRPTLQPASAKP